MTNRIGDAVFIRSGSPAMIRDRDPLNGKLSLDQDLGAVQKGMRHGYINGLTQGVRSELYRILDEVKDASDDPKERVERLNLALAGIEGDPTKLPLTRYLRAEMMHVMNTHNIKPKQFTAQEIKAR